MGGFSESAKIEPNIRLSPAAIIRDYFRVLLNPLCVGYVLCNAAAAGAVFAYITGSSLFFINALGLSAYQYGLIFGTSSLSLIIATLFHNPLAHLGGSPPPLLSPLLPPPPPLV